MRIFVFLPALFMIVQCGAQPLKDRAATGRLSAQVAELFKQNKVSEAFELLAPHWPIGQEDFESVKSKSLEYLDIYHERFAPAHSAVMVKEEAVKDFALRETWCVLFRNNAIRLTFIYYKNQDGWILNAFKWDDRLENIFP